MLDYNSHNSMPLFWLRVALTLYGLGLLCAVVSLWQNHARLITTMLAAAGAGMVFHFVSLTETAMRSELAPLSSLHQVESLLAFLLMVFFLTIYGRYQTASPGIALFPLAFLLTLSAQSAFMETNTVTAEVSPSWIYMHVGLILVGYSALIVSFFASILYLIQERNLKAKGVGGFKSRLPALATLDEIGHRRLPFGFPFITFLLLPASLLPTAPHLAPY